jgi:geranylgeranyl pyrophosphate synthase
LQSDARRPELLAPLLQRYEALDYARQKGQYFADRARERLSGLSASPAREVLAAMTQFVMSRSV